MCKKRPWGELNTAEGGDRSWGEEKRQAFTAAQPQPSPPCTALFHCLVHPSTSLGDGELPEASRAKSCFSVSPAGSTSMVEMRFAGWKTETGHQGKNTDLLGPGRGRMELGGVLGWTRDPADTDRGAWSAPQEELTPGWVGALRMQSPSKAGLQKKETITRLQLRSGGETWPWAPQKISLELSS